MGVSAIASACRAQQLALEGKGATARQHLAERIEAGTRKTDGIGDKRRCLSKMAFAVMSRSHLWLENQQLGAGVRRLERGGRMHAAIFQFWEGSTG